MHLVRSPSILSRVTTASSASMIFVSKEEAQLAENRERGLDSPGWYRYYTFTDQHGNTRHKAEPKWQ